MILPSLASLERAVWALGFVARALVIWRLYSLGIHKKYRWFTAYWIVTLVRSVILYQIGVRSELYFEVWRWSQPLLWVLSALVVAEIYSLLLAEYPGISTLCRWFFYASSTVAAIISLASVLFVSGEASPLDKTRLVETYQLVERGLDTSMAIFLLLLFFFVHWLPVRISSNLIRHVMIYGVYFLSTTLALFYRNITGVKVNMLTSVLHIGLGLLCQLAWLFLLTREGELKQSEPRIQRVPEEERRLLNQLASINSTLLRVARK